MSGGGGGGLNGQIIGILIHTGGIVTKTQHKMGPLRERENQETLPHQREYSQ